MALRSKISIFTRGITHNIRFLSQLKGVSDDKIVVTDDGEVVVCWHPRKSFPYECSLPLPERKIESNSALKVQNLNEVRSVFKAKSAEVTRQELMRLTYTTKHCWFPRARDKKRKNTTEKDRPYL